MELSLEFTKIFLSILFVYMIPVFLFQIGIISILGYIVWKIEGWDSFDAFYWAFITGTTVGYWDIKPSKKSTKALSIIITLFWLIFTGLLVAVAVESAQQAFVAINGGNVDV